MPRSSRCSSTTPAASWSSVVVFVWLFAGFAWPTAGNAWPSPPETEAAASPAATGQQHGPRSITSSNGPPADRPTSTTCACSASTTTATSKPQDGPSAWPTTANPNGSHHPGSTPTRPRDATPSTTDPTSTSDNPPPPPERGGARHS